MAGSTSESPVIHRLRRLFDGDSSEGPLEDLRDMAVKLKKEVETITKEVGGDVWKSHRYKECDAIIEHIRALERISNGSYTFNLPARNNAHGTDLNMG